jgi:hypothetical protein
MPELTFYRQARRDGGLRTGIELDGSTTLLADFQEGLPELQDDPLAASLVWYVDVRCHGDDLPTEPEAARHWFLENRITIEEGLGALAEQVAVGTDDAFPVRWADFPGAPEGVQIEVVCSAIRCLERREIAKVLRQVASGFEGFLNELSQPVALMG